MNNIVEWIDSSANEYGNKCAFRYWDKEVSFFELRNIAQRIGLKLFSLLNDNRPVAVIMPKGIETVCAYFGVAYTGRIYAPIDSSMPTRRIQQIIETINPSAIVTTEEMLDFVRASIGEVNTQIFLFRDIISGEVDENDRVAVGIISTDPLYVIFTSGSSGTPKGVVTSHLALMTYIESYSKMMRISSDDVIANQSPLDYIAAIRDIYLPIYSGCTTVILDKKLFMQPGKLFEEMDAKSVTCAGWSASSLATLSKLHAFEDGIIPKKLNKLCFSGSVLGIETLRKWQKALPEVMFVNQYGPTEVTASCTYYVMDHAVSTKESIPIGVPYDNYRVFIIDEHGNEANKGAVGEICVTGPGLALGYYNNPEKTRERFVQNPLAPLYNEMMYKTGDYGHMDEDGNLWFHGRMDRQIKIMGHRVELDAIESTCSAIAEVTECACIFEEGKEQLHLFYVGDIEKADLLKRMKAELPMFMVPRIVDRLDDISKLPNGKIDYEALSEE